MRRLNLSYWGASQPRRPKITVRLRDTISGTSVLDRRAQRGSKFVKHGCPILRTLVAQQVGMRSHEEAIQKATPKLVFEVQSCPNPVKQSWAAVFDPLFADEKTLVEQQSAGRVHDRHGRSYFWASWRMLLPSIPAYDCHWANVLQLLFACPLTTVCPHRGQRSGKCHRVVVESSIGTLPPQKLSNVFSAPAPCVVCFPFGRALHLSQVRTSRLIISTARRSHAKRTARPRKKPRGRPHTYARRMQGWRGKGGRLTPELRPPRNGRGRLDNSGKNLSTIHMPTGTE